jgi:hypothetical protein
VKHQQQPMPDFDRFITVLIERVGPALRKANEAISVVENIEIGDSEKRRDDLRKRHKVNLERLRRDWNG